MKRKLLGLMVAGMMMAAGSAHAAILSVTGGGASTIPAGFDLTAQTGLTVGDPILTFNSGTAAGLGLEIDVSDTLTFEYLGSEAANTNTISSGGSEIFSTATASVGDTALVPAIGGADFLVDFIFASGGGGTAANGGPIDSPLSFAFAAISNSSVIVLFGDGAGDQDFDDMAVRISVSQVPLPPAVWLLISAILGLVSFSRIRRKGTQAA